VEVFIHRRVAFETDDIVHALRELGYAIPIQGVEVLVATGPDGELERCPNTITVAWTETAPFDRAEECLGE